MCNCAGCGAELLGESMLPMHDKIASMVVGERVYVRGRVKGRPYCAACLEAKLIPPGRATPDEYNPWQENAVRAMEDQ